MDAYCISLIKAKSPIRELPPIKRGRFFDSAFLDSTLKKLLNLATKIEKLREALVPRQSNVKFLVILKKAFYTYKSDFSLALKKNHFYMYKKHF